MKRYTYLAFALATTALLTGTAAMAQDTKDPKEPKEPKEKLKQYDELIIRKNGDKDGKVVIEIKDGEVLVDGKPLEDFESDNISVRRARSGRVVTVSPFRQGGGTTFNFDQDYSKPGITRTFLGVVTEEAPGGARITQVSKGSPAEKAGFKEKDVITKIAGEKVTDEKDVSRLIRARKPDEEVKIALLRDGKEVVINVKLGQTVEAQTFNFSMPPGGGNFNLDDFGQIFPKNFEFQGPNHQLLTRGPRLGIRAQDTENGTGVKVLEVGEESAAEKSGIKEDDIITEFNGKKVNNSDELSREVATALKDKVKIPVKLLRDGKTVNLDVTIPKKLKTANL